MQEKLESILGKGRIEKNKDITLYTTLRSTVAAEYFFEVKTREDLIKIGQIKSQKWIPVFMFGGGSNLAITKEKIDGLVVKNLYIKKEIIDAASLNVDLLVSSGYSISRLAKETVQEGLSGLEYHVGLPGTVGGALYMNSKWTTPISYCGDALLWAYIINEKGEEKKVDREYFQFAYDYSILQKTGETVIDILFRFKKESKEVLIKRVEEVLKYRRKTQPSGSATSGCFFRNISEEDKTKLGLSTTSAGYLIDKTGLKGYAVGMFKVSEKHANFIINDGGGTSEDLVKLLAIIKERVKKKFGVELKEEVIIV